MSKDILMLEISGVLLPRNMISLRSDYLTVEPFEDSFDAVHKATQLVDRVFVLYKSHTKDNFGKATNWLRHYRFFERTKLNSDDVLFCETELDVIDIVSSLKVSCFVTDEVRLCNRIRPVHSFLNNEKEKILPAEENYITKISSWKDFPNQLARYLIGATQTITS